VVGLGFNGVLLNPSNDWTPEWSLPFFITSLILAIPFLIVPIIYYSSKILQEMQDKTVRGKWKIFMLGVVIYSLVLIGTALVNFLNIAEIRQMWSIFALILFLMVFTIYYGVGKQIK
jgi:phosphatidylglycerophosphate synthase